MTNRYINRITKIKLLVLKSVLASILLFSISLPSITNAGTYLAALDKVSSFFGSDDNTSDKSDTKKITKLSNNSTNKPSLAPMLKKAMPSVVNIKIYNREKYIKMVKESAKSPHFNKNLLPEQGLVGMGSGVIFDSKKGIIITNNHVIRDAQHIVVTLYNGRKLDAKLIGADPDTDLAVLGVLDPEEININSLPFANSERVEIGDFAFAIGSPFNLNQTVTSGIISSKGRVIDLPGQGYEDFIQTDASINVGNSGGALININGELVGINTAIIAPSGGSIGIGFAIPSNMTKSVVDQILKFGKVKRGLLGVIVQPLTPELATAFGLPEQKGALVDVITTDSVAYNSDLKVGDIITKVNDRIINNADDLKNSIGVIPVNQDIKLKVIRNKKPLDVIVKLLDPKDIKTKAQKIYPGLQGAFLDPVSNVKIPHMDTISGLKLLDVFPDSPAWQQGLRPNDIIISVNNKNTKTIRELEKAINKKSSSILVRLVRNNSSFYIALKNG